MAYAIMRVRKRKLAEVGRAYNHHRRVTAPVNADPKKKGDNVVIKDDGLAAIRAEVGPLVKRKDAVAVLDFLITASPGWDGFGNPATFKKWVADSLAWLNQTFGEDNIKLAVVHNDETTPHFQALITPVKDGRLQAKAWTGGAKAMAKLQDSYFAAVQSYGLDRGKKGSKAKHTTIKQYYQMINNAVQHLVELPEPKKEKALLGLAEVDETATEYLTRTQLAKRLYVLGVKLQREQEQIEAKDKQADRQAKKIGRLQEAVEVLDHETEGAKRYRAALKQHPRIAEIEAEVKALLAEKRQKRQEEAKQTPHDAAKSRIRGDQPPTPTKGLDLKRAQQFAREAFQKAKRKEDGEDQGGILPGHGPGL